MALTDELLAIENALWSGSAESYRSHLDEQCLVAFTEMAGVSSREEVAGMVEGGPRWREVTIDVDGVVRPVDDVAILTYHARAVRGEDERYHALVSSGYVRRDDGWKMMFHHQTPLGE